jgi:hypothetical protein
MSLIEEVEPHVLSGTESNGCRLIPNWSLDFPVLPPSWWGAHRTNPRLDLTPAWSRPVQKILPRNRRRVCRIMPTISRVLLPSLLDETSSNQDRYRISPTTTWAHIICVCGSLNGAVVVIWIVVRRRHRVCVGSLVRTHQEFKPRRLDQHGATGKGSGKRSFLASYSVISSVFQSMDRPSP